MVNTMNPTNIDELWTVLRERLAEPNYEGEYPTESAFETAVWTRVVKVASEAGLDASRSCLTSHVQHAHRSAAAWREFCQEDMGPDVNLLGSNNRRDIVFRHPEYGSIGIEVKCLGASGHTGKLTQGLGQALLGLTHRDRTLLVIHCGTVDAEEREKLQKVCNNICDATKTAVVVVP
jgi:hypothetical protein